MRFFGCFLYVFIACIACNNETSENINSGPDSVLLINASTDLPFINFFFNDKKLNSTSLKYNESTNYIEISSGQSALMVKDYLSQDILLNLPIIFKGGLNYSVFLTGNKNNQTLQYVATVDSLSAPAKGKAKYRFINLCNSSLPLNFLVSNDTLSVDDSLLKGNLYYKNASEFSEIKTGTYRFKVVVIDSLIKGISTINYKLENGKIYTFFVNGLISNQGNRPLTLKVINNR